MSAIFRPILGRFFVLPSSSFILMGAFVDLDSCETHYKSSDYYRQSEAIWSLGGVVILKIPDSSTYEILSVFTSDY